MQMGLDDRRKGHRASWTWQVSKQAWLAQRACLAPSQRSDTVRSDSLLSTRGVFWQETKRRNLRLAQSSNNPQCKAYRRRLFHHCVKAPKNPRAPSKKWALSRLISIDCWGQESKLEHLRSAAVRSPFRWIERPELVTE